MITPAVHWRTKEPILDGNLWRYFAECDKKCGCQGYIYLAGRVEGIRLVHQAKHFPVWDREDCTMNEIAGF